MKWIIKNLEIFMFSRFVLVGIGMFIFGLLVYYVTLELLELPLYPTYISVYIISTYLSYHFNARFTFRHARTLSKLSRYYLVFTAGLIFGVALLWLFDRMFDFRHFLLVYLVLIPRVTFTYIFSKLYVFRSAN